MLERRRFLAGAGASLLAAPAAFAQAQRRVPRIACLSANPATNPLLQAFQEGLRAFGYSEGQNIVVDYFLSPTIADLPQWAAKAVASNPDVIVAIGLGAQAAKDRTTAIPIVFAAVDDAVSTGLVASLARPGGNVTGPVTIASDIAAKRLQMLSQFVPGLARVAVLYDNNNSQMARLSLDEVIRAGKILGIDVRSYAVSTAGDLAPAFASAVSAGAQAIQIVGSSVFAINAQRVAEETLKRRLPSIGDNRVLPDTGGLIAYGANLADNFRRAAYYVDRILKGARPADLPVEQPMLFDLVINKKTADALGLEIPLGLYVQATDIIE